MITDLPLFREKTLKGLLKHLKHLFQQSPIFFLTCATGSELPSNKGNMEHIPSIRNIDI